MPDEWAPPLQVDFKLNIGGSPDVMDLAPPLRNWLKNLIEETMKHYMVGGAKITIPLSEWYGEPAEPAAPPENGGGTSGKTSTPAAPQAARSSNGARCAHVSAGGTPPINGSERQRGGPDPGNLNRRSGSAGRQEGRHETRYESCMEGRPASSGRHREEGKGSAHREEGTRRDDQHAVNQTSTRTPAPGPTVSSRLRAGSRQLDIPSELADHVAPSAELRSQFSRFTSRHSCAGGPAPFMSADDFFGAPNSAERSSSSKAPAVPSPPQPRGFDTATAAEARLMDYRGWANTPSPSSELEANSGGRLAGGNMLRGAEGLSPAPLQSIVSAGSGYTGSDPELTRLIPRPGGTPTSDQSDEAPGGRGVVAHLSLGRPIEGFVGVDMMKVRATERESGAVGELYIEVLHAANLNARPSAKPTAHGQSAALIVSVAIGDGEELHGRPIPLGSSPNMGGRRVAAGANDSSLEVQQLFRLAIHDSVTQKLRLRAALLTKQPKRELNTIGSVDIGLADLRVDTPVARTVKLDDDRQAPTLLHLHLTYRLLAASSRG